MNKPLALPLQTRWMLRKDMDQVCDIEKRSSPEGYWTEDVFAEHLRQRNCIGMVAEFEQTIFGYMLYEFHKGTLKVIALAVDPHHRRRGVGEKMVCRLIDKLASQRRSKIQFVVREQRLNAQLFLRSLGFRAIRFYRDYYDSDELSRGAILFQYSLPLKAA